MTNFGKAALMSKKIDDGWDSGRGKAQGGSPGIQLNDVLMWRPPLYEAGLCWPTDKLGGLGQGNVRRMRKGLESVLVNEMDRAPSGTTLLSKRSTFAMREQMECSDPGVSSPLAQAC